MSQRDPDLNAFFTDIAIIDQLMGALRSRRLPPGLSLAGFGVMNHMVRMGLETTSPAALARALQVTRGAITGVLHKLTAEGFVTLEPDPDDGRGKKVRITPAGLAARQAALDAVEPLAARLEREMDLEAIRRMHPDLRRIREYLDNNRDL
ncbi:MAG: MarR family winged helix-turn-helix transcriptional regulator [Phenylobacterium sp.]